MRVAVCVSGACVTGNPKGDIVRNDKMRRATFPGADFYYATWESYRPVFEKLFPNEHCEYFPEPEIPYHPYMIEKTNHISPFYEATVQWIKKGGKQRLEWSKHHTKQILIHAWLLDTIKDEYDVIVRTRFDGFISKNASFEKYLEDTYVNNRANCFSATKQQKFDELNEFDSSVGKKHNNIHCDQLIIHPADAIDIDTVNLLHEKKLLHAAEFGWYQVISMPHGSRHRNHDGWVNHDKRVLDKFLLEGIR